MAPSSNTGACAAGATGSRTSPAPVRYEVDVCGTSYLECGLQNRGECEGLARVPIYARPLAWSGDRRSAKAAADSPPNGDQKFRSENCRNRRGWTEYRLIRDREAPGSNPCPGAPGPRPLPRLAPRTGLAARTNASTFGLFVSIGYPLWVMGRPSPFDASLAVVCA